MRHPLFLFLFLIAAALFLASACVPAGNGARDLLAHDYVKMTDPELQGYYRKINDQLAKEARLQRRKGEYLHSSAADAATTEELLSRRNAVRSELERRNLRP